MTNKSFFKRKTAQQIKQLELEVTNTDADLVERIMSCDKTMQGIALHCQILPEKFLTPQENFEKTKLRAEQGDEKAKKEIKDMLTRPSRLCLKHGAYVRLDLPPTQKTAYSCNKIPLKFREEAYVKWQKNCPRQEENDAVGYKFRPIHGRDQRIRMLPLAFLAEAAELFSYAETKTSGITVRMYDQSRRVKLEGAIALCQVPSRQKKKSRYNITVHHVPIDGSTQRRTVPWRIHGSFDGSTPQMYLNTLFRNTDIGGQHENDIVMPSPHEIAAYMKIIATYKKDKNYTPLEMSPFAFISQKAADLYQRLNNNVLIKCHLTGRMRKLHVAEKSILLSRGVWLYGHDEMLYCDPHRDGRMQEYQW